MELITVYLRLEPTTDSATLDMRKIVDSLSLTEWEREQLNHLRKLKSACDVQVYRDKEATNKFARFGWFQKAKPTKRNKYVTINCYKWKVEWLPPLSAPELT